MTTNDRETLRLVSPGLKKNDIASAAQCAHKTMSTTLARAKACDLRWLLPEDMSDKEQEGKRFPRRAGESGLQDAGLRACTLGDPATGRYVNVAVAGVLRPV